MENHSVAGPRVLVVEDQFWIAEMIAGILKNAGYEVVGPANTVQSCLTLIEERTIDVAILDINLGAEMSYVAADALIAQGVPIIFVTGYQYHDLPQQYHAVPLMAKPTTPRRLLHAIARLLDAERT